MDQIFYIFLVMSKKEILLRCGLRFNQVFTYDSTSAKLLINQTVFPNRKDMDPDISVIAVGVNKYSRHPHPKPVKKAPVQGAQLS